MLKLDDIIHCFVIAFEIKDLGCSDYLEVALPALCDAAEHLPVKGIKRVEAHYCMRFVLNCLTIKYQHAYE